MNIILQIIIGFLIADLLAGIFHWFEDTYLDYCIDVPILSDIAKDNELHHYFPRTILSYSYLENMYVTFPLTIVFLLILYLLNKSSVISLGFSIGLLPKYFLVQSSKLVS